MTDTTSTNNDYRNVTFPFDTVTTGNLANVRLLGTDGHRIAGVIMVGGIYTDVLFWQPTGMINGVYGDIPAAVDVRDLPTTPTSRTDYFNSLIGIQQNIIDAAQGRLATATANTPSAWTDADTQAVAAAQAEIIQIQNNMNS